MSDPAFEVKNQGGESYENCAYRIQYMILVGLNKLTKYCFFCPLYTGTATTNLNYFNMKVPSEYGLHYPVNMHMGLTGTRAVYGLLSVVDQNLLAPTTEKYSPGSITNLEFDPVAIPHNSLGQSRNLKLTIKFITANALNFNSYLVVLGNAPFPFDFKDQPASLHCLIGTPQTKENC